MNRPVPPALPPAEFEVLACLRNTGPASARQLREAMTAYRPMSHGAVVTLLTRLEKRGLITKKKGPVGKAFLFTASKQAKAPLKHWINSMLRRVFQGDEVAFVASLFETRPPTLAEVDELQKLLDQFRRKRTKTEAS
jgi:BlaI family transcriptional regulator, penicillinase repressor